MSASQETTQLQKLLNTHRRNLAHLLQTAAAHGGERFAPVHIVNGIYEARQQIHQIKEMLRHHDIEVDDWSTDQPNDHTPRATQTSKKVRKKPTFLLLILICISILAVSIVVYLSFFQTPTLITTLSQTSEEDFTPQGLLMPTTGVFKGVYGEQDRVWLSAHKLPENFRLVVEFAVQDIDRFSIGITEHSHSTTGYHIVMDPRETAIVFIDENGVINREKSKNVSAIKVNEEIRVVFERMNNALTVFIFSDAFKDNPKVFNITDLKVSSP